MHDHRRRGGTALAIALAALFTCRVAAQQQAAAGGSMETVLQRAARSVEAFRNEFAYIVAEEHYEQREIDPRGLAPRPLRSRATRSDLLLLRVASGNRWVQFRDVYEVDGRPLRDRQERLQRLFLDRPSTALNEAKRISEESSRFNLGDVIRTINVPTFALECFAPGFERRFVFRVVDLERLDETATWRIEFMERARPTLVKTLRGADVPLEGTFWIEPTSGRLVRALVKTRGTQDPDKRPPPLGGDTLMWAQVTYVPHPEYGTPVPIDMREWARAQNGNTVTGHATYSRFRRFHVETTESFVPIER